jgi:hypothetical protein
MAKKITATKVATAEVKQPRPKNIAQSEMWDSTGNPWSALPRIVTTQQQWLEYMKQLTQCRFFYRTEPLVSSVVDKLVQIGVNDIVFEKGKLSDNEFRVFTSVKPELLDFAEMMATEFLISGLVVPEVGYSKVSKDDLYTLGVKKYTSLILPDSMWVRDPASIKIDTQMVADKPTYYVKVPPRLADFIKAGGKYPDGKEDIELYKILTTQFPDFVKKVKAGDLNIQLQNDNIIRRKYTSDNPYPIPYVGSSLESLQHKRRLRRMDYSIIEKIISAIMHVKVGDKDFPITESDEDQEYLTQLRTQLRLRGRNDETLERIFQLITNHTVDIKWIFPDTATLLNTDKYADINEEILFGLGFPRLLITGETKRSGTSDAEIATLSPIKTTEEFRRKITEVLQTVCTEIAQRNHFSSVPIVKFKAIQLHKFADFLQYLSKLYDASAISRTTLGDEFGYDFTQEVDLLKMEQDELKKRNLAEFGATPNSKNPVLPTQEPANTKTKPVDNSKVKPQSGQ